MGLAAAKEDAVGDDAGRPAALFQHAQKEGQKEQLRLLRLRHSRQIIVDGLDVNRAFKRRIMVYLQCDS